MVSPKRGESLEPANQHLFGVEGDVGLVSEKGGKQKANRETESVADRFRGGPSRDRNLF